MSEPHESYSSRKAENTRVKVKQRKKTVGITIPINMVERARKRNLNISRITEEALSSILDYIQPSESSIFLTRGSFQKETRARSSARPERRTLNP
jgi:RNase P protein component